MLLSYERKLIEEEKFDTYFCSQCNNNNFNPKYFPVQSSTNQHGTVQWPDFIAKLIFVAIALKTVICEGSIIIDDNDKVEHQQQTAIFLLFFIFNAKPKLLLPRSCFTHLNMNIKSEFDRRQKVA